MNGRERLLRLLRNDRVDRVPVAPFIYTNFINEFFHTAEADPVEKGIAVYDRFGFDIVLRTCNVWDYLSEKACDAPRWRVSDKQEGDGKEWSVTTTIATPEKTLTQKKTYSVSTPYETVEAIVEYFIKEADDFEQFRKYQPPVPRYDCSIIGKARALIGDKGLSAPWVQGAFNSACLYRRLDDLLLDPYDNPGFYETMMAYFSGRTLDVARQFARAGADMVSVAGNAATSTLVGPEHFRKYVLPYEIALSGKLKRLGLYYLYHNCGDAAALLQYYPQIGMDVYESLTPPPYGDTLLEDALGKFDRRIALCGNIDQIDFLRKASPEEIRSEVKRVLALVKPRGNFILATTDYLCEGTPRENIAALAEAAREFGVY
ncbi:MAG: hypothetical protein HY343_06455 [Lentisphaerae bacterium]|nr:hypothetical protein [Lentisphaerota bacterium]